jgi:NAD(P)-dependent dehydrogenase (short-subunit alcohol dehydrogenase family)
MTDSSLWPASGQRLKEKIVLVTGASRGGGKGIALALGEERATV